MAVTRCGGSHGGRVTTHAGVAERRVRVAALGARGTRPSAFAEIERGLAAAPEPARDQHELGPAAVAPRREARTGGRHPLAAVAREVDLRSGAAAVQIDGHPEHEPGGRGHGQGAGHGRAAG